jgi:transposase-like protein/predicted DNA-binding protein YlxM (UPF0122 family)
VTRPGDGTQSSPDINSDEPWKNKELMLRLYEEEGYTFAEMGDLLGCSDGVISNWMTKHRADRLRDELDVEITGEHPHRDEDLLRTLYYEEELSTPEVAAVLDCSTGAVTDWMDRHGIEKRSLADAQSIKKGGRSDLYVYTNTGKGYERFKSHDDVVLHHRLLAVAYYGLDAVREMQIHHKNRIHWDNRPENIELIEAGDHSIIHSQKMDWLDSIRATEMYREGASSYDIAPTFDVAPQTVLRGVRRVDESIVRGNGGASPHA